MALIFENQFQAQMTNNRDYDQIYGLSNIYQYKEMVFSPLKMTKKLYSTILIEYTNFLSHNLVLMTCNY
ncbi:hypothetical protein pb186bvf_005193 [Paramecium bursaria]